mmetsp:Transcript_8078/g.9270  ORF Transcript_8078/g.9270 Transcript_8078/m.9270 type:complete len:265 (-) Transcript_8078:135-929(-)|eukprot:CAMPEP_0184020452 /NCGR_PEP_ID=MMETSP0954-20121128/9357_1 /TAXON_ID=627963 /ORGANISM="Aplanochytrium sp, Strain PBS07" /LENGTH=264 /DNA_ID=CAMNT_0026302315 /DNA_START=418 /DNA_END=1212 /DNA_ORIENTATION=+
MMAEKIPAQSLYVSEPSPYMFGNPSNKPDENWSNANWLKSRFHFAFAEYRDPSNTNFGVLRVMNDDLVQPSRGFGKHPHADMEIITYVVNGELTHKDSTGNEESLGRGSVQFMSAGTGLYHSESNESSDTPLRFIQMWITPSQRGLPVNYGSLCGDESARRNKWQHLVSSVKSKYKTPIKINQDANIQVTELESGQSITYAVGKDRQAYLLMIESTGAEIVQSGGEKQVLASHDALRLFGPTKIDIVAPESDKAHVLLVEMQKK